MIKISKQNNSLIVEGIDNVFYPNNGDNSYPLNSLIVVTDKSDMATFRSVATNDVLFSGLIQNITINGEVVTKDNIIAKFDAVSNSSTGGGTVDAYTKEEADNKFASKDELTTVETSLGNKQDTLVSGTNIKTINSQSILGEGNIEVSGGSKIYEASEMPKNFKDALYRAVYEAYYNRDKTVTIDKSTDVEEFLSNLKTGDYLQVTEEVLIQYYGLIGNTYKFAIKTGKEPSDTGQYGRLITVKIISNMFFINNNASGPVLQKNDLKTINGEKIVGSGNIEVSGVSEEQAQEIAKIPTLETEIAQKANASDIPTVQTDYDGTNKKYIYSTPFNSNYSVYSDFSFRPNEQGIQMVSDYWGSNHNRTSLFQIPLVTTSKNGVMSAADKTKLDSIPETIPSQSEIDGIAANVSALETAMDGKQPTLVSGTNIKTINSQSILGSGDLTISGVSEEQAQEIAKIPTLETELAQKANISDVPTVQTGEEGTNKNYIYSTPFVSNYAVYTDFIFEPNEQGIQMKCYYWGTHSRAKLAPIPLVTTSKNGVMSAADKTKLDSISNEWTGTQAEYDALTTKDNNTIYYITE